MLSLRSSLRGALRGAQAVRNMATVKVKRRKRPFEKILIANRGEIAVRVIRTARQMGIKTVAVYSEPDARAKHVQMADEAFLLGAAASSESYLSIPKIMDVIRQTGSQAVHPGYGFLSENHDFADALEEEGVAFIGPNAKAITAMGDKIESKKIAMQANVNVIPGFVGTVDADEDVLRVAREIGYPVMIKASAGGGGKGMRIAYNDEEALEGFRLSKNEAKSAFGDDRIFIEKFVEDPRHIEIQVLGDKHGNVVAFPERECSIQRRNQKVMEESPSCLLDEETRHAMQDQAIRLAKAVGYDSAGTVEMLCDPHRNFYFLEMNTRLQVEHPITEMITGEDLVEHMIRSAAGEALPSRMLEGRIPFHGSATECRVYAEDPFRNFLPSIGQLKRYSEPEGEGVRCDSGVLEGSHISMYYDPMICKLVTYGDTREESIDRMEHALDTYVIEGVEHNIPFMRSVLRSPRYREGRLSTKFIPEEYPDGFQGVELTEDEQRKLAGMAALLHTQRDIAAHEASGRVPSYDPYLDRVVYVTAGKNSKPLRVEMQVGDEDEEDDGETVTVHVEGMDKPFMVAVDEWVASEPLFSSMFDLEPQIVQVMGTTFEGFKMRYKGAKLDVVVRSEREQELSQYMHEVPEPDMSKLIVSPMPGSLIAVHVAEGQTVEAGQPVATVEAMKMQNVLRAEKSGVVKRVAAGPGSTLSRDQIIVEFEGAA